MICFDEAGKAHPGILRCSLPEGDVRMSANSATRKTAASLLQVLCGCSGLRRSTQLTVTCRPGSQCGKRTRVQGSFVRDVMKPPSPHNFRVQP